MRYFINHEPIVEGADPSKLSISTECFNPVNIEEVLSQGFIEVTYKKAPELEGHFATSIYNSITNEINFIFKPIDRSKEEIEILKQQVAEMTIQLGDLLLGGM